MSGNIISIRNPQKAGYKGTWLNKPLVLFLALLLSPAILLNFIVTRIKGLNLFRYRYKTDALGRRVKLRQFSCGVLPHSAVLFDVLADKLSLCGVPYSHSLKYQSQLKFKKQYDAPTGIYSLHYVCELVGLGTHTNEQLLQRQLQGSSVDYLCLLVKSVFCQLFYNKKQFAQPPVARLFGLDINNTRLVDACRWVVTGKAFAGLALKEQTQTPRLAFFVNANSINVCAKSTELKRCLQQADCLFADGSGMRIAAKKQGIKLKDNVNGTDMLPMMCAQASDEGKRIFLLGAKPGIAVRAAEKLQKAYPGLQIAGVQHGYFKPEQTQEVVDTINQSGCDILLVAMGSPSQEIWCLKHAPQLKCETLVAVGGLFDFFSGSIKRAPLWMRELGLEWIWRLLQEPMTKFQRYVVGTPEFLFRTFVLNQVKRGV